MSAAPVIRLPRLDPLPSIAAQADRLIELGIARLADLSPVEVRAAATSVGGRRGLLVVHPDRAPASVLAPLMERHAKAGFVVADMTDVDDFAAVEESAPPSSALCLLGDVTRGDELANWSPDEAAATFAEHGRSPLTLAEGIQWVIQQPSALERNHCFMTIGSRLRQTGGRLDARVPAVWISNGTGRDGAARRHAPKVGWCWAGNRHTWLGFASATGRRGIAA